VEDRAFCGSDCGSGIKTTAESISGDKLFTDE
jgi:hypothetical protein